MIDNLLIGLTTVASVGNLLYIIVGVFLGNLIGVLPGIGALAAISMLLPVTYTMDPVGAILMLSGIYYGASFGGATTSILLNLPGTASHAVTCLDGHPMALKGRGGLAIFMSMFASALGACTGIVLMMFFGPVLTRMALMFGAAEYFSVMLLGLVAASTLSTGSPLKGIASVLVGLIIGTVGMDVNSGVSRFDFGFPQLQDGFPLVALAMGLFGVADVLANAGRLGKGTITAKVGRSAVRPDKGEVRKSMSAIGRGATVGSFFGILPGTGGTIAAFMSYALEKKLSKTPERFGRGAIEGVAGPESANSAAAITSFIPTLTLGVPGAAAMALMLGALMIHNIQPGPRMVIEHPDLFWGLVMSFWLGSAMLLVLNIPLIGLWVRLLLVPYRLIYPTVLLLISIGVYSASNDLFNVGAVLAIGIYGYAASSLGYPSAPLILGFVLGPMMEENFRRALLLSHGDVSVFVTRPISAGFMAVIVALLGSLIYQFFSRRRRRAAASVPLGSVGSR